jgi:hypothetical protein
VPSTGLTGAALYWVLARVNVLVCSLVYRLTVVSGLMLFGAREVGFSDLGFPGLDWSDRCAIPA